MYWLIILSYSVIITCALESRIFNGNLVRPGEHGYLVKLDLDSKYLCSGSIISTRWILTSAHCFSFTVSMVTVWQKTGTGRNRNLAIVNSDQIITHPDYIHHYNTIANKENDLALLKTMTDMRLNEKSWAIKLGRILPNIGETAVIAGYGDNEAKQMLARDGIVHISQCSYDVKHLLCTFDKTRAGDADSGGALVWNDTLVGVISASCKNAERILEVENCTTVYANVVAHYDWIKSII